MTLADELDAMADEGRAAFAAAADAPALEEVRIRYLGRQGRLKELTKAFGALPPEEKRAAGPALGAAKQALLDALNARQAELAAGGPVDALDITLPVAGHRVGTVHPLSRISREVELVFERMGFDVVEGPHVETDDYNFTRLNIPEDHPARDSHDTFWLTNGLLLRTHTSSVQSHVYEDEEPPLRKVVVGKVFRYEEVDATHDNTFTQVEGFIVDEGITVGHLVGTVKTMLKGVLRRDDVETRLRPSFFPFVEPGFEVDVRLPGDPQFGDWMELMGCGLIHPRVLAMGGIDPDRWSGFAFGMGLERLCMIRHQIDDIRVFNGADLRALHQFR